MSSCKYSPPPLRKNESIEDEDQDDQHVVLLNKTERSLDSLSSDKPQSFCNNNIIYHFKNISFRLNYNINLTINYKLFVNMKSNYITLYIINIDI